MIDNAHFEPELTRRGLRERLRLITPHWLHYLDAIGTIMEDFSICEPKEGLFIWNQTFTHGDMKKVAPFHSFFPRVLQIAQPVFSWKDSSVNGVIRTLSRIHIVFINFPIIEHATSIGTPMFLKA